MTVCTRGLKDLCARPVSTWGAVQSSFSSSWEVFGSWVYLHLQKVLRESSTPSVARMVKIIRLKNNLKTGFVKAFNASTKTIRGIAEVCQDITGM
jgi:hypothetical protein